MDAGAVVVPVTIAILVAVFFARHREPAIRARFLRRVGFGAMALFAVFFGLFVAGETISDPGGWEALGLTAAWAVPLAVLAVLGWRRPVLAGRVLVVLIGAAIGVSVWFALNPEGWRSFEDRHGPVRTIGTFVLAAAIALYGLKRTALAGLMLLVLGVVPMAVSRLGHDGFASLAVASSVPVVTGVIYLLSAAVGRRSPPPDARAARGVRPKTA